MEVDRNLCVGSGLCVDTAPAAFRLDSARQSHPVTPDRAPSDAVLAAAEDCPVEAISIRRADTGAQVFPPADE